MAWAGMNGFLVALSPAASAQSDVRCPPQTTRYGKNGSWQRTPERKLRDQLRTVEHLDLGNREFQEAWVVYRLTLDAFRRQCEP
jgi:hypothetical protein